MKRKYTFTFFLFLAIGRAVLSGMTMPPQASPEDVWNGFLSWFKTSPPDPNPARGYLLKLRQQGVSPEEIQRQSGIIQRMFFSSPEAVAIYYDRAFTRKPTGDPSMDVPTSPSAFLVTAVQDLKPGTALDAGMGQGRNAIFLAQKGWDVTGFDISGGAIAAAESNAIRAGVSIRTAKASYNDFDFGAGKWDLIVLTFAWAPVSDPAWIERIGASLRKNGRIVFEHFVDSSEQPHPEGVRALKPGQLRSILRAFVIESYEELEGTGDWGGPGSRLVRAIARKP
jgi:SAM-dependent methyltransferase